MNEEHNFWKRWRREKRRKDLQELWNLISERLSCLEKALAMEANPAIRFQLEQQIKSDKQELKKTEGQLEEIEESPRSTNPSNHRIAVKGAVSILVVILLLAVNSKPRNILSETYNSHLNPLMVMIYKFFQQIHNSSVERDSAPISNIYTGNSLTFTGSYLGSLVNSLGPANASLNSLSFNSVLATAYLDSSATSGATLTRITQISSLSVIFLQPNQIVSTYNSGEFNNYLPLNISKIAQNQIQTHYDWLTSKESEFVRDLLSQTQTNSLLKEEPQPYPTGSTSGSSNLIPDSSDSQFPMPTSIPESSNLPGVLLFPFLMVLLKLRKSMKTCN